MMNTKRRSTKFSMPARTTDRAVTAGSPAATYDSPHINPVLSRIGLGLLLAILMATVGWAAFEILVTVLTLD